MTKSTHKKQEGDRAEIASVLTRTFQENPYKTFSIKHLAGVADCRSRERKALMREVLDELCRDEVIEPLDDGRYRRKAGEEDFIEGIVDMTASGTVYVMVEGRDKDIVVEPQNTAHALNGDRVRVIPLRKRRNGALEVEIVVIVERADIRYVGRVELSKSYAFIKLDSRKMPNDVFVPLRDLKGAEDGHKVVVRILEWPMNMKNPVGEIVEVLGRAGDNDTEMHAILAEYDLPYRFPEEVEAAAERIPDVITEQDYRERRDFRSVPTFTIDPADAKDFDDALSIRRVRDGVWEVGVHIADVTHYVHPGDIVDTEAEQRATSVYLVDRTIPMLPERLSNVLCSLRPNEEKLCFSAVFELDEEANVLNEWFGRTVIHSDRRFAYEEAQRVIETGEGDMREEILTLHRLAQRMRAERFRHGSIAFGRGEAKFVLDEAGRPLSVFFKEQKESNQLIEEFMLLANKKVAEFIGRKRPGKKAERTFVYRVHDAPDPEKLAEFKSFIVRFGYTMKAEKGRAVAKALNKLLKEIKGKKEENLISTLAIRSMAKATYTTDNIGHYGLAFDYYTHFTSPIRRYPDMMVHRLLAHYLGGGKSEEKKHCEDLCEHSSAMEIRASEAERASIKYKMVEYMADKIGEEYDGTISGVTEWGIYVELSDTKIEGMVALRDMTDDYYTFDDLNYCVTGRMRGHRFTLGDGVRIKVLRADLQRKQLDFEMVGSYDFDTREQTRMEPSMTESHASLTERSQRSPRKGRRGGKSGGK